MRTILAILVVAAGCASHDGAKLSASDYQLSVEMNTTADLDVLAQAKGVDAERVVAIVVQPAHGTADLGDDGILHYMPALDYLGDDEVDYTITNPNGKNATGHVTLTVGCATCAIGATVTLAWNANPASDMVEGYRTYMGATTDTTMMTMIDDISVTKTGFDPNNPSVTYDGWTDLHLHIGDMVCFAMTAYNSFGESGFSNAACTTVQRGHMKVGLQ
jgi:hypothetical protein